MQVQNELETLPDWQSRLNCALREVPKDCQRDELYFRTALTAIVNRIKALTKYNNPDLFLEGEVILVRPSDFIGDNCGLTQVRISLLIY